MRRKLFSLLLIAVMAIVLSACENKNEVAVNEALDLITVPSGVVADFELEVKKGSVDLTWVSADEDVLKVNEVADGAEKVKISVTRAEQDKTIELTVKAKLKKVVKEKKFSVVVYGTVDENAMNEAVNVLAVPANVIENFTLPLKQNDVSFTWVSSNEAALKVEAGTENVAVTVTRAEEDVAVELTVTAKLGHFETEKKYTVTVFGTNRSEESINTAVELVTVPKNAIENFTLPLKQDDVELTWSSSNEAAIKLTVGTENVTATVTRAEEDVTVKLTLVAKYQGVEVEKEFNVTIFGTQVSEAAIETALELIVVPETVNNNFTLPVKQGEVNLTWSADKDAVKFEVVDGNVVAKVTRPNEDDLTVNVTVVGEMEGVEGTKTFEIKIIGTYVEKAKIEEALSLLALPELIKTEIKLPITLEDYEGLDLEWVASNTNAVKIEVVDENAVLNVVKTENKQIVKVTVTGILNDVKVEKEFTIEIPGLLSEQVDNVARGLVVPERTSADITIPTNVPENMTLTWTTSNAELLDLNGKVTRPNGLGKGVKLVATLVATPTDGDPIQVVREFFVYVYGNEVNVNGVYSAAFSEVVTLNPLMSTGSSDSDVYSYLVDSLFHSDYNWDKAIADGVAEYPGDFSQIRGRNESALDAPDKHEMPALGFIRTLGMAAKFPFSVKYQDDFEATFGVIDEKKSKEHQDNEWIITLRDDLKFADGRIIDASVFEYTFKQYLDGKQNNERANYLYNKDYVPLVNAEAYFKQGKPIDPENPDGEKWPATSWEDVGFEIIDDLTFKITLTGPISQWGLMTNLGIIYLVHPERFEAGFDKDRIKTSYGSISNMPASYGPYILSSWEDDVKFTFTRNENYFKKEQYSIKTINGPIITSQTDIINEFKDKKLDIAGVGGQYWSEFMDNPNLYVAPSNSFYRFAISLDRSGGTSGKTGSPILQQDDFRRALYLATDREDYTNTVQAPSQPALGYLSNIHQVNEWATGAYASSSQHLSMLTRLGLSPETKGYNIEEARRLFGEAYAKAVAAGDYQAGDKVVMEFAYYNVETNERMANWVKAQYERVFNNVVDYEGQKIEFEIKLDPLNQAQFTAQRDAGDFDMCFTGMSGATFQATFGMGYIFSRSFSSFLVGRGHDTGELPVEAEIVYLFDILTHKKESGEDLAKHEQDFLDALDDGVFTGTFDELFLLFSGTRNLEVEYQGQQDDLTNITAALEEALLKQMVAIPLFSATSAAVLSERVIRVAPAYSLFMGWGGLRYTHIKAN